MNGETPHILVVDDDTRLRSLLRRYLTANGFRVTTAEHAADARAKLASLDFDAIVLDVMMPGEDGIALTGALRRDSTVPILLLTAMNEPEDRIRGLEHGADDYLPKPFEPRELVLRIGTMLRRARRDAVETAVRFGDCRFDLERAELRRRDAPVRLSEAEAGLLGTLARAGGRALSRDELVRRVGRGVSLRSIDVQVNRLRRKIEPDPKLPRHLVTVRGTGYVLWLD